MLNLQSETTVRQKPGWISAKVVDRGFWRFWVWILFRAGCLFAIAAIQDT